MGFVIVKTVDSLTILVSFFAETTGLEPVTFAVTGRHCNQLYYASKKIRECLN